MATERTRLLDGCVITIPVHKIEGDDLELYNKTKGLSLEELMPFNDDPWWQNVRKTFFLSFWLTLIVIFSTACVLSILQHGSCPIKNGNDLLQLNSTKQMIASFNDQVVSEISLLTASPLNN